MKAKKIMSVLLAACLTLGLGACGSGTAGENPAGTVSEQSAQAEEAAESQAQGTAADISEEVTLRIYAVGNSGDIHQDEIYQRINEITKEKINAVIEVTMLSWGDYVTKLPAILASGEDYDLTYTSSWCYYKTEGPKGAFCELTEDMLKTYMPKTYVEYPQEAWEEAKLDGKIYMIPCVGNEFESHGYIIRGDLRKKYGVNEIKTLDDLEAYFAAIKENEPGMTPIKGTANEGLNTAAVVFPADYVLTYAITTDGLVTPYDSPAELNDRAYMEEVQDFYRRTKGWYDNGYIANDILSSKTTSEDYFKAGQSGLLFTNINNASDKRKAILQDNPDWELEYVDFEGDSMVEKTAYISNGMAVGRNSKNPERALMFMELCYQDEELYDLINYGLEGVTYIQNEDGTIGTPEVNNMQEIQMDNLGMGIRNIKFAKVREDEWDVIVAKKKEYETKCYTSPLNGITFNMDEVNAELAAINNIFIQYERPLMWGIVDDTDAKLEELMKMYDDAGMQKVLELANKQIAEQIGK